MRDAPKDWTLVISDHGNDKLLLEIREEGRLIRREWVTLDQLMCENRIPWILTEIREMRRLRSVDGGGDR